MTDRTAHPAPARRTRLLVAVVVIVLGTPVGIAAWIGGILLAEAVGIPMSPEQVLAWILSAVTGTVLWPLALHRLHRQVWRRSYAWDASAIPPRPQRGEAVVRATVVVLGAASIVAVGGPLDTVSALSTLWAALPGGPREHTLVLQLVATVTGLVLTAPILACIWRARRRAVGDRRRQEQLQERESWVIAAGAAWTVALLLSLIVSVALLKTL